MTDYTELKRLATRIVEVQTSQDVPISKLFDDFEAAACPETILALIAENERLSADFSSMRGSLKANAASIKKLIKDGGRAARERDQLRAEVAGLKTGYEAYERVNTELKAEVDRLNEEYDKAWRHDLNDKKNVQALAAEVARLSADSEALRKDAERYRWLRQDDVEQCRISRTWSEEQMDAAIDAALGQGEQS